MTSPSADRERFMAFPSSIVNPYAPVLSNRSLPPRSMSQSLLTSSVTPCLLMVILVKLHVDRAKAHKIGFCSICHTAVIKSWWLKQIASPPVRPARYVVDICPGCWSGTPSSAVPLVGFLQVRYWDIVQALNFHSTSFSCQYAEITEEWKEIECRHNQLRIGSLHNLMWKIALPCCTTFCWPWERLPWCQQVPETPQVDLKHAYGERVCGWTVFWSMRKQFLNSSRNNTELTISPFLQSVIISSFIRTFERKVSGTHICHKFSSKLFRTSTNQPLCRFFLSQSVHKRECRHCAHQGQIWGLVLLLEKHPLQGTLWNESYCQKEKLRGKWKITLCWLLIKSPINTEFFLDPHWLDCNLLMFDSNQWFSLQVARLDQWPYPAEDPNTSWILAKLWISDPPKFKC